VVIISGVLKWFGKEFSMFKPLKPALLLQKARKGAGGVMNQRGLKGVLKLFDSGARISVAELLKADTGKLGTGFPPPGDPLANSGFFRIIHRPHAVF